MMHWNMQLKEDLAVSRKQSVPLKPALKRAHTARHPPQAPGPKFSLNYNKREGEESRNMVSVPEGALGQIRA